MENNSIVGGHIN